MKVKVLVAQLCPALCNPLDCSLPGSSVHGILQARILRGLPFPSPGNLLNPGTEPKTPALQAYSSLSESPGKPNYKKDAMTQIRHLSKGAPRTGCEKQSHCSCKVLSTPLYLKDT